MKKLITLLLCAALLCGCAVDVPVSVGDEELEEIPENLKPLVIGSSGFYVNAEDEITEPDINCYGVFQFIDEMYYVGIRNTTTYVLGHLADGVYDDLMKTQNAAVTYFNRAFGVSINGEQYDTSGIIEDTSDVGELGYHIKLLDEEYCVIAYIYNDPTEDTTQQYYNEVDNSVFDDIYVSVPDGFTDDGALAQAIQLNITTTYLPEDMASDITSFACFMNDDGSVCVLTKDFNGNFEFQNNKDDRYELGDTWQYVVDTQTDTSWLIQWAANPYMEPIDFPEGTELEGVEEFDAE